MMKRIIIHYYVRQFITLIAQHDPKLEDGASAKTSKARSHLPVVSRPMALNFDQSQTHLRSTM